MDEATKKMWEDAVLNDTNRDREIVAWRNRFPNYVYDRRTGMVISREPKGAPVGDSAGPQP